MEINKNLKFLALIVGLLVVVGVAAASVAKKQTGQEREQPKSESASFVEVPVGEEKETSRTGTGKLEMVEQSKKVKLLLRMEGGELKIFVEPMGGAVPLSAFALKLVVEGKLVGKLIPGDEMVKAGWSFPIASAKEVGGGVEIGLSGVFISTQKIDLEGSIEIVGVPVESINGLKFVLDDEATRFFIKNGRQIEMEVEK